MLVASLTLPDFEIGDPLLIDFGRKQQFRRIVAQQRPVGELDHGKTDVEEFKGRLLPFPFHDMADHEDRLSPSFRPQLFQRPLGRAGNGETAARTGSGCGHTRASHAGNRWSAMG